MAYTNKQLDRIVQLRDSGKSWEEVAQDFNKEFELNKSGDTLRKAYNRTVKQESKSAEVNNINTLIEENSRILLVSDLHIPYHHPDAFAFLDAVKQKYKPTRVIIGGDECDKHALSFHDSDPDLPSAGDELKRAKKYLAQLYKMFPVADVLESNHGSMHLRKGKHHGIPRGYFKEYKEILNAPDTWEWHLDLSITLPSGASCYFNHGLLKHVEKLVGLRGTCAVQFHYHEDSKIIYISNPEALLWGLQCGCLIDKTSMAFAYNRVNLKRPILSVGLIIDSYPVLVPMVVEKGGRWIGGLV